MARTLNPASREELAHFGEHWGWLLSVGVVYLILGVMAMRMPVPTTYGLTFAIAWLLLFIGAVQIVQAIRMRNHRGHVTRFFQPILPLLGGALMLRYPEGGILTVALVLSFYFIISGAAQGVLAMSLRPHHIWLWGLLGSLASFAIGAFIIFNFPFSALWVPGLLLGIDLIFAGVSMIGFALTVRQLHHGKGMPFHPLEPSSQMGFR